MLLRSSSLTKPQAKSVLSEPDLCKPARTLSSSGSAFCQGNRNSGMEISKKVLSMACKKSDAIVVEDRNSATDGRKKEGGFKSLVGEKPSERNHSMGNSEGFELDVGGGVHESGGPGPGPDSGSGGGSGGDWNSTDAYYQKMLEANPGNPLLLGNYAKFLHEVQRDVVKAEEYYERAIVASPGDGDVLSLYANLIWETDKDLPRAQTYFDQAVKANPDDCYVLASYASFLWNTEEEEEEEEEEEVPLSHTSPAA